MDPSQTVVHILIGDLSDDQVLPNSLLLANEYGKEENRKDIYEALKRAGFADVINHSITLKNYRILLDGLREEYNVQKGNGRLVVLLNLVDGTESDGYPGLRVIQHVENLGVPFTGSNAAFYHITNAKPGLKQVLIDNHVSTSSFVEVRSEETIEEDVEKAVASIGFPLIIKPSVSYASYGISDQSVVHNQEDAVCQIRKLLSDKTAFDGIFMEKFLAGREFTVLVTGDESVGVKVFPAVERAFNESLPIEQRFLAFERYWNGYTLTGGAPTGRSYEYRKAADDVQPALQKLARDAYVALGGTGYARVDIRSDDFDSSSFFVLEVNAQCSVTCSSSSTSGEILAIAKVSSEEFLHQLIQFGITRYEASKKMLTS